MDGRPAGGAQRPRLLPSPSRPTPPYHRWRTAGWPAAGTHGHAPAPITHHNALRARLRQRQRARWPGTLAVKAERNSKAGHSGSGMTQPYPVCRRPRAKPSSPGRAGQGRSSSGALHFAPPGLSHSPTGRVDGRRDTHPTPSHSALQTQACVSRSAAMYGSSHVAYSLIARGRGVRIQRGAPTSTRRKPFTRSP